MDPYERMNLLLTEKQRYSIEKLTVLILGVGGVGGYAVEALARCGIGHIILVDNDIIDITNLNRQIIADYSTIGHYKVDIMEKRIYSISKRTKVTKIRQRIDKYNIHILFDQKVDYIIDACDTLSIKKELLKIYERSTFRLISSMGTGNKLDPLRFKIMDIRKTSYDPIARDIRKFVVRESLKKKIYVVCSDEKPINIKNQVGSISFVPSVVGFFLASFVIRDVIQNGK